MYVHSSVYSDVAWLRVASVLVATSHVLLAQCYSWRASIDP